GPSTVTLSTGSVTTPEICANGRDDDMNGLTDCQDAACKNDPSCVGSECVPDLNLGTLVVDGPSKAATANLRTANDDYQWTCSAGVARVEAALAVQPAGARRRGRRDRVHAGRARRPRGPVLAVGTEHLRALPHAGARARLRRRPEI